MFTGKGTAVVTNVPGPSEPVYLAGTPIRAVLVWAPTSGHIGMSVSIFSYRGEVTVGLMVDAALVPDPGEVVNQFERELKAIARQAPIPGTLAVNGGGGGRRRREARRRPGPLWAGSSVSAPPPPARGGDQRSRRQMAARRRTPVGVSHPRHRSAPG